MSVINQMLKELDQRNGGNNTRPDVNIPSNFVVAESNNRLKIITIAVIVILAMVTVYYLKFQIQTEVTATESLTVETSALALPETVIEQSRTVDSSTEKIIEPIKSEPEVIEPKVEETVVPQIIPEQSVVEEPTQRVVKSQRQPDTKAQAERLYKSARRNIGSNQLSAARQLLNQAIDASPDFHKARVLLFSLMLQQQQIESLKQEVEKSLQQWPAVHEYRQVKARLLVHQKMNAEAVAVLDNDIPAVEEAPEYHALLAYVAQQSARDQLAVKHYQLLLQQQPGRADWWLGLAVSEEKLGNQDVALKAFQHAVGRPGLSQSVQEYARQRIRILQGF